MVEKRRGLGRGIGALFPVDQEEVRKRPIDIFFNTPKDAEQVKADKATATTRRKAGLNTASKNILKDVTKDATPEDASSVDTEVADIVVANEAAESGKAAGDEKVTPVNVGSRPEQKEEPAKAPKKSARSKSRKKVQFPGVDVLFGEHTSNFDSTQQAIVSRETLTEELAVRDDSLELQQIPGATFGEIELDLIVPNMHQPRQVFDEEDLAELADSIREVGVLQPIVIRPLVTPLADKPEARYELIMGERRWRASRLAGNTTVPAIVRHTDTGDMLRDALLENLHRSQLNALEEAAAYQQLMEDFKCTQEELSRRIARSRPQISNTLRLLKLPPLVQRRVAAGVLSAGHARALLGLADAAAMERLAQRIVAENLSVRTVEELVALGEEGTPEKPHRTKRAGQFQPELNGLATRLMDRFETKVKVVMGQKKGRISIDFGSIDDLNRILTMINEQSVNVSRETSDDK